MEKYYLSLIINEVKNFKRLQKHWGYKDLDDLIAHYIEEDVISSKKELEKVLKILEMRIRLKIDAQTFNDWWLNKR